MKNKRHVLKNKMGGSNSCRVPFAWQLLKNHDKRI